jgi:hypothetical protein
MATSHEGECLRAGAAPPRMDLSAVCIPKLRAQLTEIDDDPHTTNQSR